jgi:hypothetical protein
MKKLIAKCFLFLTLFVSYSALGQTKRKAPTLAETLQWLSGASEENSTDGNTHTTFKSKDRDSCTVTIRETRLKAGPDFWIRISFSLADIDPADIHVENRLLPGQSSVTFHTTNFRKTIMQTQNGSSQEFPTSYYIVFTNDWFAPRFAKALKRAVGLCGGKPSSF